MKKIYSKIKNLYNAGSNVLHNQFHIDVKKISQEELKKIPTRTEVINYLLHHLKNKPTTYLEIGVRNPDHNYNHVRANKKYSVDPGIEFKENPVDFKITSDDFFNKLKNEQILDSKIKFDIIFIDGLHLAEQVDKDIQNSLHFLHEDGFLILHDCNPPTEWHAREEYEYKLSPAERYWNGTVWKTFYKFRFNKNVTCCCIDSDWGIGIISKKNMFSRLTIDTNPYLEYAIFDKKRKEHLNLINFIQFTEIIEKEDS